MLKIFTVDKYRFILSSYYIENLEVYYSCINNKSMFFYQIFSEGIDIFCETVIWRTNTKIIIYQYIPVYLYLKTLELTVSYILLLLGIFI